MGMSEIIQKMKVFLSNEIPEEIEVKMTDVKTKDGIILSFEGELVSGIEIFVVDETGKNPATDGEYILEDGKTIVVAEGKISEIKPVEEPIETPETEDVPVVEMPMAESGTTETKMEEVSLEDLKCKVKKLEEDFTQLSTILSELATEMGKTELKSEIKTELQLSKVSEKNEKNEPKLSVNDGVQNILKNIYKK